MSFTPKQAAASLRDVNALVHVEREGKAELSKKKGIFSEPLKIRSPYDERMMAEYQSRYTKPGETEETVTDPVTGDVSIETDDEVFLVAPSKEVKRVLKELDKLEAPFKRIIIAGGGHIGKRLALALEKNHQVKIIEKDVVRAHKISIDLSKTLVLLGDCTDEGLLLDESIESIDLFCAITDNDGVNIISASLAKSLGARKTICLLNQNSYTKLLPGTGIDVTVLPNQETLGSILMHVRRGDVARVTSLCGGTAEAIEAIAHASNDEGTVVGRRVDSINFPAGIVMGALIRNSEVIPIHHDTVFAENDHVVMFAMDKKLVSYIEQTFQPI